MIYKLFHNIFLRFPLCLNLSIYSWKRFKKKNKWKKLNLWFVLPSRLVLFKHWKCQVCSLIKRVFPKPIMYLSTNVCVGWNMQTHLAIFQQGNNVQILLKCGTQPLRGWILLIQVPKRFTEGKESFSKLTATRCTACCIFA